MSSAFKCAEAARGHSASSIRNSALSSVSVQSALKQLEDIVHPLVYGERQQWLQQHTKEGRYSVLVLDIPLLYETAAEGMVNTHPML